MRTAIMQPYFIPYAGYFRLLAQTDLFVIYDCVQFPRRGWVHRNKLEKENGEVDWLTLNLKKSSQDTKIKDLEFADGANELWQEQLSSFPAFNEDNPLINKIKAQAGTPLEFIVETMKTASEMMEIPFNVEYSSSLGLGDKIRGQDRIIAIAKHFGTTEYLNASGGTELYDVEDFANEGIELKFLPDYENYKSILERLTLEDPAEVGKEISG